MKHQLQPGHIANFGSQQEAQRIYDLAKELGVPVWEDEAAMAFSENVTCVLYNWLNEVMCAIGVRERDTEITPAEFEARLRGEWVEEQSEYPGAYPFEDIEKQPHVLQKKYYAKVDPAINDEESVTTVMAILSDGKTCELKAIQPGLKIASPANNGWISVDERLPEIEEGENTSVDVIVWAKSTNRYTNGEWLKTIGWYTSKGRWMFVAQSSGNTFSEVSHWMNPAPPTK